MYSSTSTQSKINFAGLTFKNSVGLAAGFDKNGKYIDALSCLGFGHIEVGTVTPLPQDGNPKPRLFRLKKDEALINRMGFNNDGSRVIAERLRGCKTDVIIGVNIGKNKATPNEKAVDDYEKCFRELYEAADYFVVNVSSPNTPGLRELQEKDSLSGILKRLQEVNSELSAGASAGLKPVFLKIAPDLTHEQLDEIISVVLDSKINGVIATNTTIGREHLQTSASVLASIGAGGLSGKPVTVRSTEVIQYVQKKSSGSIPIIGVGGIHSPADALDKINAGASLVQLYTGFIYEGPGLLKRITAALNFR